MTEWRQHQACQKQGLVSNCRQNFPLFQTVWRSNYSYTFHWSKKDQPKLWERWHLWPQMTTKAPLNPRQWIPGAWTISQALAAGVWDKIEVVLFSVCQLCWISSYWAKGPSPINLPSISHQREIITTDSWPTNTANILSQKKRKTEHAG